MRYAFFTVKKVFFNKKSPRTKRCFSENNIYFVKNNNFFKKQFRNNRITTGWKSQFFIIIRE